MMKSTKKPRHTTPVRVRREPPTVAEAVTAAQDLSDDIEQQVEIAAGLIGLTADEVRPHVVAAKRPERGAGSEMRERIISSGGLRGPRTVVVERKVERKMIRPLGPVVVERRLRPIGGRG
jgi:hypothetical protein